MARAQHSSPEPSLLPLLLELARSPLTPVLVIGKDAGAVARRLHDITYPGGVAPFVTVDCTWLPANEAGHLLFGFEKARHVHRGFMERANGGTLFLDDITELPGPEQARLAKALDSMRFRRNFGTEETAISLRIVAALRGNLAQSLERNRLRRDLHARLGVCPIVVPG